MRKAERLSRSFYLRPTVEVARDLLGKYLVYRSAAGIYSARLVEVEAYIGEDDPACHAAPGKTERNAVMYGPGGFTYIYKIYGMHFCLNFVTEREGYPAAILIRAGEPHEGFHLMKANSPNDSRNTILSGPGRFCRALHLSRDQNDVDLTGDELYVEDRFEPEIEVGISPRVGISKAVERPLRFFDLHSRSVSGKSVAASLKRRVVY